MRRCQKGLLRCCFLVLIVIPARTQSSGTNAAPAPPSDAARHALTLRETRQSPLDLEIGGELAGLPRGTTRFLTREDLLALPQVDFMVIGDTNFADGTRIAGVRLEDLVKRIPAAPASAMAVAICDDAYRANYPRDYMAAHHPILVLNVNGKPPADWPKDSQEHKYDMGPYMISHAKFVPSFKILSYSDEPQIPWGVVRIEFRNEKEVYGMIAPRGPWSEDAPAQAGYRIAKGNCFRCHNAGPEGGTKSGLDWLQLSHLAAVSPKEFGAYVRNPASKNAKSQMPGNPSYDDATLKALNLYFQGFQVDLE
jgi:mono/diheme cytochrome c family protein